jgi:hypothetical protein
MKLHRRDLLKTTLGGIALRAVATGIPASILLNPRPGRAAPWDGLADGPGRMLILFASRLGDPINANVPGTYGPGAEEVAHPEDPAMAETTLQLSGQRYAAAKPWADLPQNVLNRTVFFHHATFTPVHQDQAKVMRLMGSTDDDEMLVSIFAKALGERQGSVQKLPLSLGATSGTELLSANGQVLANASPTSIQRALGGAQGRLARAFELRDRDVDRVYNLYKEHGTKHDLRLLDAWARSRDEVRTVNESLLARLDVIDGNNEDNQVTAASVLAAMNITPVITVHGDFGGDNHNDTGLVNETTKTVTGVARMGRLMTELDALRSDGVLRHEVVVSTLNVFGRTLRKKGTAGRDHNRGHHVTVMMGDVFKGSVIGGIERSGNDYVCRSIDPVSGAAGGSIPYESTLGSMAKTLALGLGLPSEEVDQAIELGQPVEAAFA